MARPRKPRITTLTWLGEDNLHHTGYGPQVTTWGGIDFPKGVPVEVSDDHMIAKAKNNSFFEVDEQIAPDEPE